MDKMEMYWAAESKNLVDDGSKDLKWQQTLPKENY